MCIMHLQKKKKKKNLESVRMPNNFVMRTGTNYYNTSTTVQLLQYKYYSISTTVQVQQ